MNDEQLDDLIEKLNGGDTAAAEQAFLAYEPYLRMAIRRQLTGPLRSKLDSMDIVQSVWADVLRGLPAIRLAIHRQLPSPRIPHESGSEPAHRPPPATPSRDRARATARSGFGRGPAPGQPAPAQRDRPGARALEAHSGGMLTGPSRDPDPEATGFAQLRDRPSDRAARGEHPSDPLRAGTSSGSAAPEPDRFPWSGCGRGLTDATSFLRFRGPGGAIPPFRGGGARSERADRRARGSPARLTPWPRRGLGASP